MGLVKENVITSHSISLLEISIDYNWELGELTILLDFVSRTVQFLANTEIFLESNEELRKLYNWSKTRINQDYTDNPTGRLNSLIERAFKTIKQSFIDELVSNITSFEKQIFKIKTFKRLDSEIRSTFSKTYTPIKVVRINYNSPGEILIEIPKKIAEQTNDLLNTILFYNKRRKQLEFENQSKEIEVKEKIRDYENNRRLDPLNAVIDDLTQAILVINQLAELKQALQKIGATEDEANEFVRKWLLDRMEIVFPSMDNVSTIGLLA